jgi:Tol biopolymer transport system component
MSLAIGSRVGTYEVLGLLGVGGMGEVYRARDTKLGRDVALKILPEAFAADAERLTRFEQEARTLASLNHPNIAQIFGLEQSGQTSALAMELVQGEDLAQRIARGPLTIDESLQIARQIAKALEAAHEAGVVHRDLKPANIKIRDDGTIKVLDFGLAKAGMPAGNGPARTLPAGSTDAAATIALPATMHGVILGTAAYMAPEQARGKSVDRRADIWAFGVVLYEMLTGRAAFAGETVTDVLASVIDREPDWTALPEKIPAAVHRLLTRCLEKDARRRLRDMGDASLELDAAKGEHPRATLHPPTRAHQVVLPWSIAALCVIALVALLLRSREAAPPVLPAARLDLTLPADQRVSTLLGQSVAITSDGRKVAYVAQKLGTRRVYVQELDSGTTIGLPGTEFAQGVYFSPPGDAVGFVNSDRAVYRLSLSGGAPTHMAQQTEYSNGTWADSGFFISRDRVLWHIPLSGEARQLTTLDAGELSHTAPHVLPGGRAVVFTVWGRPFPGRVELLTLADGKRRTLAAPGVIPVFSAGHILYATDGALLALPFDVERLLPTGDPFVVLPKGELHGAMTGSPYFAASTSGTLIYLPADSARNRLVWVSRDGSERPLSDGRGAYGNPKLSPDGRRLLVEERGAAIWVVDLARQTQTRVLSRAFVSGRGLWLRGGTRLLFKSWDDVRVIDTEGDSSGSIIKGLTASDLPTAVHPDGDTLAFTRADADIDVFVASIDGKEEPRAVVATPRNDLAATFSPDGRWLLYNADDSGQFEVYLRPYPAVDRRWQVSTGGGVEPRWSTDGREIYYRQGAAMMAVKVTLGSTPVLSDPVKLFEAAYAFGEDRTSINYDVAADGRFVMIREDSNSRLRVILNWPVALGQGTTRGRAVDVLQH